MRTIFIDREFIEGTRVRRIGIFSYKVPSGSNRRNGERGIEYINFDLWKAVLSYALMKSVAFHRFIRLIPSPLFISSRISPYIVIIKYFEIRLQASSSEFPYF